jgi:hypothetical protein
MARRNNATNGIILTTGIAAGPLLAAGRFYWGWCWGWWGRGNLLMQYLLQCNCPASSEPARYPQRIEVVVSGCQEASIQVSPGGHFAKVHIEKTNQDFLLDLQTGMMVAPPANDAYGFITDDLLLASNGAAGINLYLIDRQSGKQSPITRLDPKKLPGGTLTDGNINPDVVLPLLHNASKVFVSEGGLLLLGLPSQEYSASNYFIDERDWLGPYWESGAAAYGELTREYLEDKKIPYVDIYAQWHYPDGLLSHSGAFVAKRDGIYLSSESERITESYELPPYGYFIPGGWVFDDRGVLLRPRSVFLIDLTWLFTPLGHHIPIPQPILILNVPDEYLPPAGGS